MDNIICIDVGGSSIKKGICSENGKLEKLSDIPLYYTQDRFMNELRCHIKQIIKLYKVKGVAFSIPGVINKDTQQIIKCNMFSFLQNVDLVRFVYDEFQLPSSIANDAHCAALAEIEYNNSAEYNDMIVLVCGTGIGGAIVKDREIHSGANMLAGEFGNMHFYIKDKLVKFSRLASTISCVTSAEKVYPNEKWTGIKVFDRAAKGDLMCVDIVEKFYSNLALGVINIQQVYDPEIFFFGGAISDRKSFLFELSKHIKTLIDAMGNSAITIPNIDKCLFTKDSNLIGASVDFYRKN